MDVDVSCGFPPEEKVTQSIRKREAGIVKVTSETYIGPFGPLDMPDHLDIRVLPDGAQGSDLDDKDVRELLVPHQDTCARSFAAKSGVDVYNNIKSYVDTFGIFTKCTKVYVPNQENGIPKMRKDDIIAIVTEPYPGHTHAGHFTVSYEDVAQYQEYVDSEGTKTLLAMVTSRKESVIEGNYDIKVQLFTNQTVLLTYTKRRHLAEWVLDADISHAGYIIATHIIATQGSVDRTMLKLAYAGRYGPEALDEDSGCYAREYCLDDFTLQIGEVCSEDQQCATGKCRKENRWCLWGCTFKCKA